LAAEQARVKHERLLWPYRDSCSIRVIRVHDGIRIASTGDDRRDDQKG
jgi:hypothetical protein